MTQQSCSGEKSTSISTQTLRFTAALFTIAKTWKRPNCPWTDTWIQKMWYRNAREYQSKKGWNNDSCSNMDELRDDQTKWSKWNRKASIQYELCAGQNLTQMNLPTKQKQPHRHREQPWGCQGVRERAREGLGGRLSRRRLLPTGSISSQGRLRHTGDCRQTPGVSHGGRAHGAHVWPRRRAAQHSCTGFQYNTANQLDPNQVSLRSSLWRGRPPGSWGSWGALPYTSEMMPGAGTVSRAGLTAAWTFTIWPMLTWRGDLHWPGAFPEPGSGREWGGWGYSDSQRAARPTGEKIPMTRRGQAPDTDTDMCLLFICVSLNQDSTHLKETQHCKSTQIQQTKLNCEKRVGQETMLPPCGPFLLQPFESRCWWAPHIHKACGAVKDSWPQGMSWDKSSEKNSKQDRLTRSQFQAESWSHTV